MATGRLESLLQESGVATEHAGLLASYGELVLEANRRTNLTGARTVEAFCEHIIDSLKILPYVADPHVDVGSGAGIPAIPLAIVGGVRVTMIEATSKKARFLEKAAANLGLRVVVVAERAEKAAHNAELRERFESGTARAVAAATTTAELLLPFIAVYGRAVLQRGQMSSAERNTLSDAALVLGGHVEGYYPGGGEREIVILRKDCSTPPRFPRRIGIPAKRPLCENVSRETF